jgi:FlaA1/EpsC-like NDP-sugar epimerase
LFTSSGFKILHLYEAYSGQFLCIEASPTCHLTSTWTPQKEDLEDIPRFIGEFAGSYHTKVIGWQSTLRSLRDRSQRIVVWGAGSKGVTFLNMLRITENLSYVVDVNPRKQWMFVAGTGQQIVPPTMLRDYKPDVILVMNPIYRQEIADLVAALGLRVELITV